MGEHDGHRKRILEKLDSDTLLEHELLEIVLFPGLPRRNTNDLAHRLLAEFGSLKDVFAASYQTLRNIQGLGDSLAGYICVLGKIMRLVYKQTQKEQYPKYFERESFLPYVKEEYRQLKTEVLDVYLLDGDGRIITRRRFQSSRYFTAEMQPEELTKLFVEYSPAGIVLVHNHPYGEATVSEMDEYTTKRIQLICNTQNILLCDHIVYAPDGVYSYYLSERLQKIAQECSLKGILGFERE